MRGIAIALALAGALIVAGLAAGAWELRRLDRDVQTLRTDVEAGPKIDVRLDRTDRSVAALKKQTAKVMESNIRQEFYAPLRAYQTQLVVAFEAGSGCGPTQAAWDTYVDNTLIPFLDKAKNREARLALQHDDPDYRDTLRNALHGRADSRDAALFGVSLGHRKR
jgi:hypothetical protein